MKLATRDDGTRDGRLLLVDLPLARAVEARACTSMIEAVRNWDAAERELRAEYAALASGDPAGAFPFDASACGAILPTPTLRVAAATAPQVRLAAADAAGGLTVAAELAIVVGEVPADADRDTAVAAIRAFALTAGTVRDAGGAIAWRYAPVAATPDALGEGWDGVHVQGTVELVAANGGDPEEAATAPLGVDVPARIVAAAAERELPAGTVVGLADPADAAVGAPEEPAFRLDMRDGLGRSLFGSITLASAAA
jgi:fumarylacetoacetate (FAA) hydrolase